MEELLVVGIILAVLFVVLNALTGAFSGGLSQSWSSGIGQSASFIGPILVIALAGAVLAIVKFAIGGGRKE